ncbi:hypothetical protein AMETH_2060 [Amycolatopsis methanolica 239]|uniref:Uncharacterized protein n=1 Tax=Amycolatopsis methanolica 239 TaxID=1068978 RepID=A0A076MWT2_AMYME|nr:hypothetical protein AMETH_2060 [Amycolatopsis methanolica 239]
MQHSRLSWLTINSVSGQQGHRQTRVTGTIGWQYATPPIMARTKEFDPDVPLRAALELF